MEGKISKSCERAANELCCIIDSILVSRLETDSFVFFFSSRFIRAVKMSKWPNQISRIRVSAKTPSQKEQPFSFQSSSLFLHASVSSSNGVLEYSTRTRVQLEYHFLSTRTRNPRYSVGTRTRRSMYSVKKRAEYTSTFGLR